MPEATTTTSSNTNPDAALLVGGPAASHGQEMPKTGEVHPESKVKVEEKVKYELNGKTFQSAEEMSKYVADLEKKVIERPATVTAQQANNQPQKVLIKGMTIDQLMFADPEAYTDYIKNEAKREISASIDLENYKTKFWSNFYTENPDLRGKEDLVEALKAKNFQAWSNLQEKEYAKVVADTSRSTLKKLGSNATEVRPGEAAALSASGQGAPQIEATKTSTNFVDEMNIRRLKRKTK